MRAPSLYDDPVVATPGVLEDVEGEAGPTGARQCRRAVRARLRIDNRDQVQPMLDSLYTDAVESQEEADPEAQAGQARGDLAQASREASEKAAKDAAKK